MKLEQKILVIGAGIGGVALARALEHSGFACELFERAPEVGEVGAGLLMQAGALNALRRMGLDQKVVEAGKELQRAVGKGAGGKSLHSLALDFLRAELGQPLVAIHRARLHRVLLDSLEKVPLRLGKTLERFEQDASGVTAFFTDGTSERGSLLIGADGIRSAVRRQLLGETELRYAGYSSYRGLAPKEGFGSDEIVEIWGRGARFGYVPIGHGETYWFAVVNAPEGAADEDRRAAVLERFGGFVEPVLAIVEATPRERILRTDIHDRAPVPTWSEGRVTLLGDAAHPTTPNLGQGACMAIEDAVTLARCLESEQDHSRAFAGHERRRVGHTTRIVNDSFKFGKIAQMEARFGVWLRDLVLGMTPDSVIRGRMIEGSGFSIE